MEDDRPRIQSETGFEDTWPNASALATECVLNLQVLSHQMATFGQALVRKHGLPTVAAFNVLTILHGADSPLPPSAIAERMIVSRPTVTGILGTLERRGLIRRSGHQTDGRMSLISITADGRSIVERLLPQLHEVERRWLDCLSEDEQQMLLALVARLQANGLES